MKLSIRNLGGIQSADLEIAPLTVFIGPNNTNKTWAAYGFYGLMRALSTRNFFVPPWGQSYYELMAVDPALTNNIRTITERVVDFLTKSKQSESSSTEVMRQELVTGVTFPFRVTANTTAISKILTVPESVLPEGALSLEVSETEADNGIERASIVADHLEDRYSLNVSYLGKEDSLFRARHQLAKTQSADLLMTSLESIVRRLFLLQARVVAFPAERKALASLYQLFLDFPRRETQPSIRVSRPVYDYAWFLSGAADVTGAYESEPQLPSNIRGQFDDIVLLLEGRLLNGRVSFTGQRLNRGLDYRLPQGQSVQVHGASSLVKSLAGLDVYLAFARSGDTLIIDEPEMNAHPEAQLMAAELLAILVNRGIRVVITTHSPYIVDHLNNLIEAAKLTREKQVSFAEKRLTLGTPEAVLPREKVAVYRFEKGGRVVSAYDAETEGFDLSTFGNVSDYLRNLYSDILESGRGE